MDKYTFKVCEAVALGLTHYYMGYNDKRKLTEAEIAKAKLLIPALPTGWMHEKHEWDAFAPWDKRQKKKHRKYGKRMHKPGTKMHKYKDAEFERIGRYPDIKKIQDGDMVMLTDEGKSGGYIMSRKEAERLFPSIKEKCNG